MGKNIVFCADGTWNGPHSDDSDGVPKTTNVWKLFAQLSGSSDTEPEYESEQEIVEPGEGGQVGKYLHGVGDSSNPLTKLFGGALGAGLITRIVRGYTYISRNYVEGDSIFLIGFSRGAYTARALAGLIVDMGLLQPDLTRDPIITYRMGMQAWRQHQENRFKNRDDEGKVGFDFNSILDHLPHLMFSELKPDDLVPIGDGVIKAVAVWDTVGALGIPAYVVNQDERYDAFKFADTALSSKVSYGFQAISLDEQRADFSPTFWDARNDVTQVIFPGAHADVGGGYAQAESGLSDTACRWMITQLTMAGVHFKADAIQSLQPDSRGSAHQPWLHPPFDALPYGPRSGILFPNDVGAHVSIFERLANGTPGVRADPSLAPGLYSPACFSDLFGGYTKWVE